MEVEKITSAWENNIEEQIIELKNQIKIMDDNFKLRAKEKWARMDELEKRIQKLNNTFLNIHLNSEMFLKIMRLEQRKIASDQEIAMLDDKIDNFIRLILQKFKEIK